MIRFSASARVLANVVIVAALATLPLSERARGLSALVVLGALVVARRDTKRVLQTAVPALLVIALLLLPLAWIGVEHAHAKLLRAGAAAVTAIALATRVQLAELGPALRGLLLPRTLTGTIEIMARQLGALTEEARAINLARRLRGATGTVVRMDVVAALFERSLERAEQSELAARLRGYEPGASTGAKLRRRDWPLVAFAVTLAVGLHLLA